MSLLCTIILQAELCMHHYVMHMVRFAYRVIHYVHDSNMLRILLHRCSKNTPSEIYLYSNRITLNKHRCISEGEETVAFLYGLFVGGKDLLSVVEC